MTKKIELAMSQLPSKMKKICDFSEVIGTKDMDKLVTFAYIVGFIVTGLESFGVENEVILGLKHWCIGFSLIWRDANVPLINLGPLKHHFCEYFENFKKFKKHGSIPSMGQLLELIHITSGFCKRRRKNATESAKKMSSKKFETLHKPGKHRQILTNCKYFSVLCDFMMVSSEAESIE